MELTFPIPDLATATCLVSASISALPDAGSHLITWGFRQGVAIRMEHPCAFVHRISRTIYIRTMFPHECASPPLSHHREPGEVSLRKPGFLGLKKNSTHVTCQKQFSKN